MGELTAASSFIFALTAGFFLYISLVDMVGFIIAVLLTERNVFP